MKLHSQKFRAVIASLLLVGLTTVSADETDGQLVVRVEQSLQQVVTKELNLAKYARQIAAYNNIANVTDNLPIGTTIAIPRPYLKKIQHGRIAYVKGDVMHKQPDLVVNPPAKGAQVYKGDIIQTGADGFVSLTFKSGARVHIQPDSRVVINNIDCINDESNCVIGVSATKGQVSSDIVPRRSDLPPVQFTIDTPFLTAAVRGTEFYVDLDEALNRIGVTEGQVATDSGGQTNDLPAGQGLSVAEGLQPELVELLDPPSLNLGRETLLFSPEDDIGWLELSGAQRYRADIAVDESMAERVASVTTESVSIGTPVLSPGDYFLTVAAIDESEFLGLPVKQKLAIAEIGDAERPELNIKREDGVTEISVQDYNGRLELFVGNSVDLSTATSRILESAAETVELELDETRDWVFRARKLLDTYTVSPYSEFYVFVGSEG